MKQAHTVMSWFPGVIKKIKDVLITIFLIAMYYILFGIFLVVVAVFDRKLLWPPKNKNTFWIDAGGYTQDIEECRRQS